MKRTVKFGIFGLGRGGSFYNTVLLNNGEIVAVCDLNEKKLADAKKHLGENLATYTDFDEFINHEGLEAIFLCNYFHEHAEYAIKALKKNIHVLSECTSNGTMAEGVELVRAAEESRAIYMLAENYPFMKFNREMRRVYQSGTLGQVLFAEGEYNHPMDYTGLDLQEWRMLHPYAKHWRNHLPGTYYVTHSLAPLMYITESKPIRVTAFAANVPYPKEWAHPFNGDRAAIINCLNDDGSVYRVTGCAGFGAHENSYRICGTKGQIENIRGEEKVLLRYNKWDVPENANRTSVYNPEWNDPQARLIDQAGHGGGDFLVIREFFDCIRENRLPMFDVYFATTMASVAILAHRSVLEGGRPYDIPDFRKEEDRKEYENDRLSPFYGKDGSAPTLRTSSHVEDIPTKEDMERYDRVISEIK